MSDHARHDDLLQVWRVRDLGDVRPVRVDVRRSAAGSQGGVSGGLSLLNFKKDSYKRTLRIVVDRDIAATRGFSPPPKQGQLKC